MSDEKILSFEQLKSLIAKNCKINQNFDNIGAMLVLILEQVMAFIRCGASSALLYQSKEKSLIVSLSPAGSLEKYVPVEDNSIASWVIGHKQSVVVNDYSNDTRFPKKKASLKNILAVPVLLGEDCLGVIEVFNKQGLQKFSNDDISLLELFGAYTGILCGNAILYNKKNYALSLLMENPGSDSLENFLGTGSKVKEIEKIVEGIAKTDSAVLITGENGSGKKVFATSIHEKSSRKSWKLVYINCANKSSEILEKEIFGEFMNGVLEKGAISKAENGTLVIDDVSCLSLYLQDKLMAVLQKKVFEPKSSVQFLPCNVRLVAITSRNLELLVQRKIFREDLYYKLNILPLNIPPLRRHMEDVKILSEVYLEKFSRENNKKIEGFSSDAIELLQNYKWPGNIVELRNAIERACIVCSSSLVKASDFVTFERDFKKLFGNSCDAYAEESVLEDDKSLKTAVNGFKKQYIKKILEEENWNQTSASRVLDVQRTYVSKLIAELGIERG